MFSICHMLCHMWPCHCLALPKARDPHTRRYVPGRVQAILRWEQCRGSHSTKIRLKHIPTAHGPVYSSAHHTYMVRLAPQATNSVATLSHSLRDLVHTSPILYSVPYHISLRNSPSSPHPPAPATPSPVCLLATSFATIGARACCLGSESCQVLGFTVWGLGFRGHLGARACCLGSAVRASRQGLACSPPSQPTRSWRPVPPSRACGQPPPPP